MSESFFIFIPFFRISSSHCIFLPSSPPNYPSSHPLLLFFSLECGVSKKKKKMADIPFSRLETAG